MSDLPIFLLQRNDAYVLQESLEFLDKFRQSDGPFQFLNVTVKQFDDRLLQESVQDASTHPSVLQSDSHLAHSFLDKKP